MSEKRATWAGLTAAAAALGALLEFFLDPTSGRRRRHVTRDRIAAFFRRGVRLTAHAGRGVAAEAHGVSQKVQHLKEEPKDYDDATLARKVETEVFRDPSVPKGQVDVNAENGVVVLRGEVPSTDMIEELVAQTRKVQGVREVENLLHVPGTEAPMHQ